MIDINKLIKKISLHRLAVIMGLSTSTVYSWKYLGNIPEWRTSAVVEACSRNGIDISDCISEDK